MKKIIEHLFIFSAAFTLSGVFFGLSSERQMNTFTHSAYMWMGIISIVLLVLWIIVKVKVRK